MYYFGLCVNPCKSKVNQTWKNDIHWIGTFSTFLKIFISTFLSEYYAHVDTSLSALLIVFLFQLKCKNRPDPDSFIFGALFRFFFFSEFYILFSKRFSFLIPMILSLCQKTNHQTKSNHKTLPKALWTQALTALMSSFGLNWWEGFGMFGSVGLLG